MINTKFRLLEDETIEFRGKTLYRIEALKDFLSVKKGEKGGFVEKESNLSVAGHAWVTGHARVESKDDLLSNNEYGNIYRIAVELIKAKLKNVENNEEREK